MECKDPNILREAMRRQHCIYCCISYDGAKLRAENKLKKDRKM